MSDRRSTRRVVLIGSVIGAALLLLGGLAIWNLLPARALGEVQRHSGEYTPPDVIPVVIPEASLEGVRVAVVEEPENAILVAPGLYQRELERWREWLRDAGAEFVGAEDAEVLVLPLADCLGNPTRALIERHLGGGGGVVTNGVLGSRNGVCGATRDTVLLHLLGGTGEVLRRTDEGRGHVVLLGETMLGGGAPAGARIDLSPKGAVIFRGEQREAYFADWERNPLPVEGEPYYDGAVVRAVAGEGRVVAFGFGITDVMEGWSEQIGRLMVANAVRWASGDPVVQLETWPGDYKAAAAVAQDVEADYANAAGAIDVITETGIPTTYFIVGNLAETHPWITRDIVASGELASHSYSHLPMDGFTEQGQREELALGKSTAEEFLGRPIQGFRPPEERFTLETLKAWAELGGDYVFAHDQGRSAVPAIVPFGPDSLVFLGRVTDDDYELLSRYEMRDRGAMVERLTRQMDEVIALRGTYLFSYHSHILAQEQLLPVLEAVVKELKARPEIWLTTTGDIARWWRTRAAIDVVVAEDAASAELRNLGEATYSEGVLLVDLPTGERRRVPVPDLRPGEAVRVRW